MNEYNALKDAIRAAIKPNGEYALTAQIIQNILIAIVDSFGKGYQFMGIATADTKPGEPDEKEFYVGFAGEYANFGETVTVPLGGIAIFLYDTDWHATVIKIAERAAVSGNHLNIDDERTVIEQDIVNVNTLTSQGEAFLTAAAARAAVAAESGLRIGGQVITYLVETDEEHHTAWVVDQFTGDDAEGWENDDNWQPFLYVELAKIVSNQAQINEAIMEALGNRYTKEQVDGMIEPLSERMGAVEEGLAAEILRAQAAESRLQDIYEGLTQNPVIVGPLPSSGQADTIYRVPGTSSYSDYMWNGTQFVLMATYSDGRLDYINVNLLNATGSTPHAAYATADAARADISAASGLRALGLQITYLLTDGVWYTDQYIGTDISGWNTASNWKTLGPVTVTQNAETGKTELLIGDTPALIVDFEPEVGSHNLVESGGVFSELNKEAEATLTVTTKSRLLCNRNTNTIYTLEGMATSNKLRYYQIPLDTPYKKIVVSIKDVRNSNEYRVIGITSDIPDDGVSYELIDYTALTNSGNVITQVIPITDSLKGKYIFCNYYDNESASFQGRPTFKGVKYDSRLDILETQMINAVKASDIVDNLSTDDSNKVLSAKQGKVLNDKITTIESNVSKLNDQVYGKDYLDAEHSTFLTSDGITSAEMMRSFIKSFVMLTTREEGYDYGIYKVNNGLPSGTGYAYLIGVYKFPTGQTPDNNNITSIGDYRIGANPTTGKITIPNVAELVVDWSALTAAFGGNANFFGTGTGIRYNQDVIFGTFESLRGDVDKNTENISKKVDKSSIANNLTTDDATKVLSARQGKMLNDKINDGNNVEVCLPSIIYAVVGDTLQLYYRSIFKVVDYTKYDINAVCSIGAQYPRYFEVTPASNQIGEYLLTFTIKDNNNNVLGTKSTTLKVVNTVQAPSSNINVLCIGASATQDGQWASEFKRRLVSTGGAPVGKELTNITFVGRKSVTYRNNQVNLEATGGYKFGSYTSTNTARYRFNVTAANEPIINVGDVYSNNGNNYTVVEINITQGSGGYFSCEGTGAPQASGTLVKVSGSGSDSIIYASTSFSGNPFVYNGVIDMQQYADDYCNGQIDVIYTELFGNGQVPYASDSTINARISEMQTFITQCRTAFPNVKLCIGLQWNPDIKGGTGVNYGAAGGTSWSLTYGVKYTFMRLCNLLQNYITDNNMDSYVYIVNWLNEFDEENNFRQTLKKKNPRMPDEPVTTGNNRVYEPKEVFGLNGIHPSEYGYYQMSDSAFRVFIAKFCQ